MMQGTLSLSTEGGAYQNTALLFQKLNVMGFTSLLQWSVLLAVVFDVYLIVYFFRHRVEGMRQFIAAFCVLGVLNIYVFNLSKDVIQFAIFIVLAILAQANWLSARQKGVGIILAFVLESIFFRSYYLLTAVFFVGLVIGFPILFRAKGKKKMGLRIFQLFVILFIALYCFLWLAQRLMPEDYQELILIRHRLTAGRVGSENANTLIVNLIEDNGNHILYIINYFINAVRMMIPIELFVKGPYYWLFLFFQLLCTYMLFKMIADYTSLTATEKMVLYIMCAYYLVAFLFEPDFGSFVRHEATTAPVLLIVLLRSRGRRYELREKSKNFTGLKAKQAG